MDEFTFIATLAQALAWPAVVLVLVLLLRKPLSDLIPSLRRLKYKEVEMEFSREIAELKARYQPALPKVLPVAKPKHQEPATETTPRNSESQQLRHGSARRDELLQMVRFSKRVAIMEAWLEVEAAAVEIASSFWLQPPNDVFKGNPNLGQYLVQCKVIDQAQLDIFNRLRDLRNRATLAQTINVSEEDARSYVELATGLAASIRGQ